MYSYRKHITFLIPKQRQRGNAKGKLYDKYTNYIKHLRKSGLRHKRKRGDSRDSRDCILGTLLSSKELLTLQITEPVK